MTGRGLKSVADCPDRFCRNFAYDRDLSIAQMARESVGGPDLVETRGYGRCAFIALDVHRYRGQAITVDQVLKDALSFDLVSMGGEAETRWQRLGLPFGR